MKKISFTVTVAVAALCVATFANAQSAIPLSEHPRPDFERSEWINLNGEWNFTFDRQLAEQGIRDKKTSGFDLSIQVPFPWGSKLSGVASQKDVNMGWYGRNITVPEAWKGKRIFLIIGACEWDTKAWFDGALLGSHQGGYTPFEFELTDKVRFGSAQSLTVCADDPNGGQRLGGKQGYGDARGIWQTVYLEARGERYIDYVHFSPDIDRSTVVVEAALDNIPDRNAQIRVRFRNGEQADFVYAVKDRKKKSSSVIMPALPNLENRTCRFEIKIDRQHLWTLDDPYLYEMEIVLENKDKKETATIDRVNAYFGQRKIGVTELPGHGFPYVALNNKPVYLQMCLDQSYHPEGFYTFPSDRFMRDEIILSKRLGLNANRIHIKTEIPRKLYWADRLGLLIMADIPNWWGEPDDAAKKDWQHCLHQQIRRDYNHPAIFSWVNFNETWGLTTVNAENKRVYLPETQEWVRQMYLDTKKADPTRLVEDNSPCNYDHVQTDLNTWHGYVPGYQWKQKLDDEVKNTYPGSSWNFTGNNKQDKAPMLNSECGNVWGYEGSAGDVDYTWDYHIMMNEFRSHPLCAGWLYTEHHDVINEWNGYVRYDRSPKIDGLDAFVPGMTVADFHTLYYIAPQGDLCRDAVAGASLEIPLFASFMTDRNPGALRLETTLAGWDALGNETATKVGSVPVSFKPFLNEPIAPAKVQLPEQRGLYVLRYELKNAEGTTLGRNFSLFVVKDGKPPVTDRPVELLTFDPAKFSDAKWSLKQWNVFDGLKVNGAGSGYFEYTLPWSSRIALDKVGSVTLVMEVSAKILFGKDKEGAAAASSDGDYMLGKGFHDPSQNRNAYPMTDLDTRPSWVKVSVNGVACGDAWLPDDPADHRGALSWHSQKKDRYLHEAGSYGYLVRIPVPVSALTEGKDIRIRIETPADGGLAIYGKNFGRYPLDPTMVFVVTN